jgi:hypothetical protein
MESPVPVRPTALTDAIRRDIVSALAAPDAPTVPAATARIAADWRARRRRVGDSPAAVQTAGALVFQVGADLVGEVGGQR